MFVGKHQNIQKLTVIESSSYKKITVYSFHIMYEIHMFRLHHDPIPFGGSYGRLGLLIFLYSSFIVLEKDTLKWRTFLDIFKLGL